MARSPYEVLGVGRFASQKEIRLKYLDLCKKHHPDVAKTSETDFREITTAYQQLTQKGHPVSLSNTTSVHRPQATMANARLWTNRSLIAGFGLAATIVAYILYEPSHPEFDRPLPHHHTARSAENFRQWRKQ
ncbi:uncharacterized protein BYT42DRAFT_610476 [Radiomyces spectabilis]|uniref:uncharacterized protein n=1 Tax=Radiomyces spectabilis TaxID=64574 RepID=UPI00221E49E4|nr:uncharacterized protein BYT42DRAFT_610476 [Radiomyces spectabilis]KAI8391229.1 hypothetical protein BYT42DRAFT_610476 [Radiomyces spectabilis]